MRKTENLKVKTLSEKKRELKIGLALGKGAARGFAHIGVLKVLEKHGIMPDMIAGCSAGSAIGALYASGMKARLVQKNLASIDWKEMFDFVIPENGLIKGKKFEDFIGLLTQHKDFADLDIPLFIIATNLTQKKKALFFKGDVARAVRASIALPGIFDPIIINGDEYVDGGLVDPIPVGVLRDNGADIIIAVDLSSELKQMTVQDKHVKLKKDFIELMQEKMVIAEVDIIKELLKAKNLAKRFIPKLLRNLFHQIKIFLIDRFIRPGFVFAYFSKSHVPKILSTMYTAIDIMEDEFTQVKLCNENIDVIIKPTFNKGGWTDMDKADYFVQRGAAATQLKISQIKKAIKRAKIPC